MQTSETNYYFMLQREDYHNFSRTSLNLLNMRKIKIIEYTDTACFIQKQTKTFMSAFFESLRTYAVIVTVSL